MRKSVALAAIAVLTTGSLAMAAGPRGYYGASSSYGSGLSYSYIDGGFATTEMHDRVTDDRYDGDGFSISGSLQFAPQVFGFASFTGIEYEDTLDLHSGNVGVGFNVPLGPGLDLVSGVSLERLRVGVDGYDDDVANGYGLQVGLRGMASNRFEWNVTAKYRDLGDDGGDVKSLFAGGRYYVTPRFAIGLDVGGNRYDDDLTESVVMLGFRYNFGF